MPYVRKLDSGLYRVQYRDAAGKRLGASFVSERDALAWGYAREDEVRRGIHRDPAAGRVPIREWEAKWWAARVVENSTRAADRSRMDRHVLARWGEVNLDEVTAMDVQAWIRTMQKSGLANDTVRKCHGLLSSLLDSAVIASKVPANLARGVTLPPRGVGREVFLSREEVDAAVAWFDKQGDDVDGTVALTLAYTGMRWGELAGLQVRRLHQLRKQLEVREVLEEVVTSAPRIKEYAKGHNRRTLPLADVLVERLAEHLARHPVDSRSDFVFRRPDGRPLSRSWSRSWARVRAAVEMPEECVPHDLRHTYASWLVMDGVPLRVVQVRMGHESIKTTERYAHLSPDADERVLDALNRHRRESPGESRPGFTGPQSDSS